MSVTALDFQAQAAEAAPEQAIEGRSQWQLTWRRLRRDKMAIASVIVIVVMILLAITAPLSARLIGHGVYQAFTNTGLTSAGLPVGPGTHGFILGTDYIGRDLLVRIWFRLKV
jgi:peptide/nickel transport system permease protein